MRRRGGFTLIEVILVMGIIFVLSAVLAPRFSDYVPSLRVGKTADRIFAWTHKARADAATTGLRHRFVFDTKTKRFWVDYEARPFKDPGKFVSLEGSWEEEQVPDEVELESLQGLEADPDNSARRVLEFRPDGTSADATIVVSNDRGDRVTIQVVGATSRVAIEAPTPP